MYSLYLLGHFQFYTNKNLAEKEAARFIKNHLIDNQMKNSAPLLREFDEAYCQERYTDCISTWNRCVDILRYGESFYKAQVNPVEIDKPFR